MLTLVTASNSGKYFSFLKQLLSNVLNVANRTKTLISGTPSLPAEYFQTDIGDAGTNYFESDVLMVAPVIGRTESGPIPSPQDFQIFATTIPQGTEMELHTSGLMSVQIQPNTYVDYALAA